MPNINLQNSFQNARDLVSPVDSRIKLNKLESDRVVYSDIKLDLEFDELKDRPLNADISTRDLMRIKNEESVLNSLRNIMCTRHGDRLLNPEMNIDLRSYLFSSVNETTAYFIAYELRDYIPRYEPRVRVTSINIEANLSDKSYAIDLVIAIPDISGEEYHVKGILSAETYALE